MIKFKYSRKKITLNIFNIIIYNLFNDYIFKLNNLNNIIFFKIINIRHYIIFYNKEFLKKYL